MYNSELDYARTQADGADNIAPTPIQGQQAWQYAQSDNFFSLEEQSAVMRKQLEPHRAQIEERLSQIGYPPDYLAQHPHIENALYSGNQTGLLQFWVTPDVKMEGRLHIIMTEAGPDIRITPLQRELSIPDQIEGIHLSKIEQQQLSQEGSLPRPFLTPDNGEYVPTYLRIDPATNAIEIWRIKAEQMPTKLMGIDLTKDQQMQLVHGHPVRLMGLIDNQGESFNATVSISASRQSIQFSDFNRLDVALKPSSKFKQQLSHNNEGAKTDLTHSREEKIGAPIMTNQQSEVIKQLLGQESPRQEKTLQQRL